nr:MAG: hypothetical protein BEN19_06135 [Epulopiscium sp. Nuni2H_MBin003]
MHQVGFTQSVASLGTALTISQAKLLKRYTTQVVLIYDNDTAGQKATLRAIPILRNEGISVKVVSLLDVKDPDEFVSKYGIEKLMIQIENAQSDIWYQILEIQLKYNINIVQEKIKFLEEATDILATIESSIEQLVYVEEVVKHYNIEKTAIEAALKKRYIKKPTKDNANVYENHHNKSDLQVDLLSALYHHKEVFPHIKEHIHEKLFDIGIKREIAKCILDSLNTNTEINIEKLPSLTIEDQQIISKLILGKDKRYNDSQKLYKMINDTLKQLNLRYIKQQLSTTTNVDEMKNLILYQKFIAKLNIVPING